MENAIFRRSKVIEDVDKQNKVMKRSSIAGEKNRSSVLFAIFYILFQQCFKDMNKQDLVRKRDENSLRKKPWEEPVINMEGPSPLDENGNPWCGLHNEYFTTHCDCSTHKCKNINHKQG